MDLNITLKVPAIEQLTKMTASGIGAVGGLILGRWRARVQADAQRIEAGGKADAIRTEAGGKADAMGLIASAQAEAGDQLARIPAAVRTDLDIRKEIEARLIFQEEKKQRNIETVVRRAADELGDREVDANDIDHDWTAAFFTDVQDVSSEQMQQLWAKILAGEVERPGTTSVQTLSILKVMSQEDAELFQRVARFVISRIVVRESAVIDRLSGFPLHADFMRLVDLNLFHIEAFLRLNWTNAENRILDDHDKVFRVYKDNRQKLGVTIDIHSLTYSGCELYGLIKPERDREYLAEFARHLQSKKIVLESADILSREGDGSPLLGPWTTVAPRAE